MTRNMYVFVRDHPCRRHAGTLRNPMVFHTKLSGVEVFFRGRRAEVNLDNLFKAKSVTFWMSSVETRRVTLGNDEI